MTDPYTRRANAQTNRWVLWTLAAALFVAGFAKATAAMGTVPATINGNAIGWPVPTWGMLAWLGVAMAGVLCFSAGAQIRGSVRPQYATEDAAGYAAHGPRQERDGTRPHSRRDLEVA